MINVTTVSVAETVQQYCASITEGLCNPYCLGQSIQPVATVAYNVASVNVVGSVAYCTIQATGSIMYQPKGVCGCCPQTRMFTESFDVAFPVPTTATGTPAIAVTYTPGVNSPANVKCNGNVYAYNMVGEVVITATFPSSSTTA